MRRSASLCVPFALAVGAILTLGCGEAAAPGLGEASGDEVSDAATGAPATYVGAARCAGCHPAEAARWRGSHHDRAMERATAESVLGRFDGRSLRVHDQTWSFHREGDSFVVVHEIPGGEARRLPVSFTFGVSPLQQLLVRRGGGRLQALPVAWDARPPADGGGQWRSLQPDAPVPAGDPVHWESLAYNWNTQCAACHSTGLYKGFDDEADVFETRWEEIDVGCEACHGPGSRHAERGDRGGLIVAFDDGAEDRWRREPGARIASPTRPRQHDVQMDVCGPCHSLRGGIVDVGVPGAPLLDGYRPRLLEEGLYFDDGQIQGEVYVWGSFAQSRMYAAGVRCSDCHDPHSLTLRREGDALCTGCHAAPVYDDPGHRGHAAVSAVSAEVVGCVDCHMPTRTYMEIDARRDHSFPVPRPLRSAALGAPDACEGCHPGRSPAVLARTIASWRGEGPVPWHWSDQLVAHGTERSAAEGWLSVALEPRASDWVRGSAWSRFALESPHAPAREVLADRLATGGPLERFGLVEVARRLEPGLRLSLLRPLLDDPLRALRVSAAGALADVPIAGARPADRAALARALREHRAELEANAERPEAQVGLGMLALRYGDPDGARRAYEKALDRAPWFVPAHVNLADLERAQGDATASVAHLRRAVALAPGDGLVRHAFGLALHRQGEGRAALVELERAAADASDQPRVTLGYALALAGADRRDEALAVLALAVEEGRADAEVHHARVTLLRDASDPAGALRALASWRARHPDDSRAAALAHELEASAQTNPD